MDTKILKLHKQIKSLENFLPGKDVNQAFSELVNLATGFGKFQTETLEIIKKDLQKAAALAEVEMEKHWSKKISTSKSPKKVLNEFWYYKNYFDLTKLEYGALSLCSNHSKHKKILFVGSGPLPLTGIILADVYGCDVTMLDIDKESLDLSKKLIASLGINKIDFVESDAYKYKDYAKFDTIFVAAMIEDPKKNKVDLINHIATKINKHTLVLVRSSFHNRELLYKKFDPSKVVGLKAVLEVRPKNEIVNSFHIFEK